MAPKLILTLFSTLVIPTAYLVPLIVMKINKSVLAHWNQLGHI